MMKTKFIPAGLNIDDHLRRHPYQINNFKKDILVHMISLVTEIPTNNKDIADKQQAYMQWYNIF